MAVNFKYKFVTNCYLPYNFFLLNSILNIDKSYRINNIVLD